VDQAPAFAETPAPHQAGAERRLVSRRIGAGEAATEGPQPGDPADASFEGNRLGTFRNTYYDFPREQDYAGPTVALFDARCHALARVPVGFHDAVCVQGSGRLVNGRTVSFARRGCRCARHCPRTDQQICFEALDPARYPWGRGATGRAITPLSSVAVDSSVIPLGTSLFIPEYVGLPLDDAQQSHHDGCFIAQDRGIKVIGAQVDIFTGNETQTQRWNNLIPSNQGVTIITQSPHCPP
jgi:3D (Asp-Asp-Asp) domain-containing protein